EIPFAILLRQERIRRLPGSMRGAPAPKQLLVRVIEVKIVGMPRAIDDIVVLVAIVVRCRLEIISAIVVVALCVAVPSGVILPTAARHGSLLAADCLSASER